MIRVHVEPCRSEFFYSKFKQVIQSSLLFCIELKLKSQLSFQSYPIFKNPRGACLIINIYQIEGMPPRRWSDRDTDALQQLFEQLLFDVHVYTDTTHTLNVTVTIS
jgi:hypothetical protein